MYSDRAEAEPSQIVRALGVTDHTGTVATVGSSRTSSSERTGVGRSSLTNPLHRAGGVVCLTGVGSGRHLLGSPPPTLRLPWCSKTTWSLAA